MRSFIEEFDIEVKENNSNVSDYDAFLDKKLLEELRNKIIQNLIDNNVEKRGSLDSFIKNEIDHTLEGYDLSSVEISYIYNLIDNEINGCGPITELLEDPNITEIMVNDIDKVYIEIDGKVVQDESISFINQEHIIRTISRMIQPLGRTIDTSNPMVDCRLKDGSRLNAIIPPLSIKGPILTIRKFKEEISSIDDLLRNGTLTAEMARFLEACVQNKMNIIICGGTGAGKTTLLNVLSSFIGHNERIITIEDACELRLKQPHVISLETRVNNYEKNGEISIRDLVINSLRMRPDRIIVGECRGKEAFDMLQAMNTGHNGSLTTMHANSPHDALNRLETLILMAGMEIPVKAIREYTKNAIDIIINVERSQDGRRRVKDIVEVREIKDDMIELKPIFHYKESKVLDNGEIVGEFALAKGKPEILKKFNNQTIQEIKDIFEKVK
ncbi:MAG: CpaF family protein [Bacilli bacterium]|nr:CpaF family protein [Bacilli bacterium]